MSNAIARVYVNDVDIGSLPADQYKNIVIEIRRDRRLWVAQILNLLAVAFRFVAMLMKVLPFFLFYVTLLGVLFAPESISEIMVYIQSATPDEIVQRMRQVIVASLFLSFLIMLISSIVSGYRYGYANQFDKDINKRIRNILEVPTEGDMRVSIISGDGYHVE